VTLFFIVVLIAMAVLKMLLNWSIKPLLIAMQLKFCVNLNEILEVIRFLVMTVFFVTFYILLKQRAIVALLDMFSRISVVINQGHHFDFACQFGMSATRNTLVTFIYTKTRPVARI